jgi:DMSO/TMAO reductase YedYZ molybdopterin-dependent catalytic subunit
MTTVQQACSHQRSDQGAEWRMVISRGFGRRRRSQDPNLPPGQHLVDDFPVLSAGPTPRIDLDRWQFDITSETGERRSWTWQEFRQLPTETVTVDIHCVTSWSKLGTGWEGVSVDTLLADVDTAADFATARSYGGYTTNVPVEDLTGGKAWVAFAFDGQPLAPEHGGPARLLVPLSDTDEPGFWESLGYHNYGDPWREQRYWGD